MSARESVPYALRPRFLTWGCFLTGFFAVGLAYWTLPYREVSLPDSLMGPGLWVVPVGAFLLCALGQSGFLKAVAVAGGAVPAVVLARVIVDGIQDSTSHNLWPIEIVIASVVGLGVALIGATLGWLIHGLFGGKGGGPGQGTRPIAHPHP